MSSTWTANLQLADGEDVHGALVSAAPPGTDASTLKGIVGAVEAVLLFVEGATVHVSVHVSDDVPEIKKRVSIDIDFVLGLAVCEDHKGTPRPSSPARRRSRKTRSRAVTATESCSSPRAPTRRRSGGSALSATATRARAAPIRARAIRSRRSSCGWRRLIGCEGPSK